MVLPVMAQTELNSLKIVGKMKDAMWKGETGAVIHIDTIKDRDGLYGLGPLEQLAGEVLVINGTTYRSYVLKDSAMKVDSLIKVNAPFFAYGTVKQWKEVQIPKDLSTLQQLEDFLIKMEKPHTGPFFFRIKGTIKSADIHVVNLPAGKIVRSPEDAHTGRVFYKLLNEKVELLGFFSTEHQTIFTHHNTFLHMHLITEDKNKMGHVDEIEFKADECSLFLPF